MKPFSQSFLTLGYAVLGLCMMIPFIVSFFNEELREKLSPKKIPVNHKGL